MAYILEDNSSISCIICTHCNGLAKGQWFIPYFDHGAMLYEYRDRPPVGTDGWLDFIGGGSFPMLENIYNFHSLYIFEIELPIMANSYHNGSYQLMLWQKIIYFHRIKVRSRFQFDSIQNYSVRVLKWIWSKGKRWGIGDRRAEMEIKLRFRRRT